MGRLSGSSMSALALTGSGIAGTLAVDWFGHRWRSIAAEEAILS
jgi:hypothetical protein